MKIVPCCSEKRLFTKTLLLIVIGKETHSETKSWKSLLIVVEKSYNNNGKPWKSLRILRVNPNVFIVLLLLFIVVHCCSLLFIVVHCCLLLFLVVHCCLLLLSGSYYSKRIIFVRWADLSDFFRRFSSEKCVFICFTFSMKIVTFLRKNLHYSPKRVYWFSFGKETFIFETKSWKSSRILTKKVTTINGNFLDHFRWGFCVWIQMSFIFFHFLSLSFHFHSFSFIFFHFHSFSFIFFHFLSFSLSLLGAQNLIFLGPQFRYDFSWQFFCEKSIFGPISGGKKTLWALFSFFFLLFFSPVFCLFSCFLYFHFFSFFVHFFIFSFFHVFNVSSFSFFQKKKFLLFFFLVLLSNIFYCWR